MTFATHPFRGIVTARAQAFGLPDLAVIYIEHPLMTRSAEEIAAIADERAAQVADALLGREH
ncbi:MAG: hypothetical protein WCP99_18995 [Burkholderiales bacterium]